MKELQEKNKVCVECSNEECKRPGGRRFKRQFVNDYYLSCKLCSSCYWKQQVS